jgi:hypothetical protein
MSFQWIINSAETLSINRRDVVGSTQARDGTVKAVSRGTPKKIFTVKLPDGPRWIDIKTDIESAEVLDKHTSAVITIEYATHPWYYGNVAPVTEESYTVLCTQFPQWSIFGSVDAAQVAWDGAFIFVEV